jgi:cytochrome c biogenesis protein
LENKKGIVENAADKVWKFFSSVKLAVVLLIILAIVSVIGTMIQQNQAPEQYLTEYSQSTIQLFETLGLFDMYHTWWFVLLLFLLTANLTVCTLDRFPHTLRIITAPLKPINEDSLKAVQFKKEILFKGGMDTAEERAVKVLNAHRYRFVESKSAGMTQLMTQKGVTNRLGVYVTHTSIILIFVGALIGSFFGFKAFLNLPEGSVSNVVYLRNEPMWDKLMDTLGIAESPVIPNLEGGVPSMPLGFFIQCDSFDVDYYVSPLGQPTGMPSEYHSTLSVFDLDSRKILDKRIRVNDPLTHHGITFYQSSYGPIPKARGKILLNVRSKNSPESANQLVTVDRGVSVYVPSINRTIAVLGFAPYGVRNPASGQVMFYQSQNDEYINPTVEIEVYNGKKALYRTYIMKTDAGQPYLPEGYIISYAGYWGTRYTGLQVTKDPGVWVVYAGFILLCIGPLLSFFGSHRKLWIWVQDRTDQVVITVAGTTNRNRMGFEREFNRIAEEISK